MKSLFGKIVLIIFGFITFQSCDNINNSKKLSNDSIFQYSTKQAFLNRIYEGNITYKELKEKGDFGLGTFNSIDGEMVALDGKFYQVKPTQILTANDSMKSPFAVLKFFKTDQTINLSKELGIAELKNLIKSNFADTSKPIAIKISGNFKYVKARTVEKQIKPYPSLGEIVAKQTEFEFTNIKGTALGYWFPPYFDSVNFPGFHFHFISEDKNKGGHILDAEILDCKIELDYTDKLILEF